MDSLDGDSLDGDSLDGDSLDGDSLDGDSLDGDSLDGDSLDGESSLDLSFAVVLFYFVHWLHWLKMGLAWFGSLHTIVGLILIHFFSHVIYFYSTNSSEI
jgi:hypothetical protein